MRKTLVLFAITALMPMTTLGSTGTVRAASDDDLHAAIVRLDDLGQGFRQTEAGSLDQLEFANYRVTFVRDGLAFQSVTALLIDYSSYQQIIPLVVGAVTENFVNGITRNGMFTSTPIDPPQLGEDTTRYKLEGSTPQGVKLSGDVLGWRQGFIVAVMITVGTGMPSAMPFAEIQRDRIVAEFGPRSGRSPAPTNVGRVDCAGFASQEAAQALLDAWDGDPYSLDPDGNGVACDSLPHRAGAATDATPLISLDGTGEGQSDNAAIRGRVEVCWAVAGRSDDGTAAIASILLFARGTAAPATTFESRSGEGCSFANVRPGSYYVSVIAPAYAHWHVTITPK